MKFKEETLNSKEIYSCPFLDIYEDKVQLPEGEESFRIYIKHIGAAAVLPVTKDKSIILVKQYRYPIGKVTYEIPAGKFDYVGEEGLECIKRELEEETGYNSDNISHIIDFHNAIAYSSELIKLYIAKDVYEIDDPKSSDDDEFIEVVKLSVSDVMTMISNNEITDAKTIIAMQYYQLHKEKD